jgi:hypothetical protein
MTNNRLAAACRCQAALTRMLETRVSPVICGALAKMEMTRLNNVCNNELLTKRALLRHLVRDLYPGSNGLGMMHAMLP